jgi:putative transposase
MLTFCEHTMHAVCAELEVELAEYNGEGDHVHLWVAYPPTLAVSTLVRRLTGGTSHSGRREFTDRCARAHKRGHLWSPSYFAVTCAGAPLPIIKQHIDAKPDHPDRRAAPGDKRDGLTPD